MRPFSFWMLLTAALAGMATLCAPRSAVAHPLGNDSITHFSIIFVTPDQFRVDLVLDIAETPSRSLQRDEIDTNQDGEDTLEEQNAWLDRKAGDFAQLLSATLNGEPMVLAPLDEVLDPKTGRQGAASRMILKIPGIGGMPTYRLLIAYGAEYPQPLVTHRKYTLEYADNTFNTIPGLRRILLEEPSLRTITAIRFAELRPGPVPDVLRNIAGKINLPLSPEAALQATATPDQLLLVDGARCWVLAGSGKALGLFRSPYIQFDEPRPSYWTEGLDPFLYEQYDPRNLPQEKSATIRFTMHAPCPGTDPSPTLAQADTPGKPQETMPAILERLNDPRNDPARASEYYRQADTLVGMLQQFGQGRGLFLFLSITFLAFIWGAGHALMPGHAKTVVAAYLISQRGTYWHAVVLAIIVTITHTALVVIVGLIVHFYQRSHPNLGPSIQLWLGTLAGVLVAAMGVTLVWRAVTGRIVHHHHDHDHSHQDLPWWRRLFTHSHPHLPGHHHHHHHHHHHDHDHAHTHGHAHSHGHDHDHAHAHGHDHSHGHDHDHVHDHAHVHAHSHAHAHDQGHVHDHHGAHTHDHTHAHDHAPHTHEHAHGHAHAHGHKHTHVHASAAPAAPTAAQPITTKMLLLLGITGGIVPCPTAMIILLLGIGANVVAWALYAVGVFSLGLALTLMLIGFAALASRRFATRLLRDAQHEEQLSSTGQRLMFQVVPALSGLVVIVLGGMIAVNYLYIMRVGRALFPWLG